MPDSVAWGLEEGCRKARFEVWRMGAGKLGLEFGGRVGHMTESEAWNFSGERVAEGKRGWEQSSKLHVT